MNGSKASSIERRRQLAMVSMLAIAFPLSGLALVEFRGLTDFRDANAALATQQQAGAVLADGVRTLDPAPIGRALAAAGTGGPRTRGALPDAPGLVPQPLAAAPEAGPAPAPAPTNAIIPGGPNAVPLLAAGDGGSAPGSNPPGGNAVPPGGGGLLTTGGGGGIIAATPTPSPSPTGSPTPTPSPTASPTPTPTQTGTPTPSPSPTPTPTSEPTPTPTSSPTPVSPLPEPETWVLMGAGAAMGSWWLRRQRRKGPAKA